jgi:hypothetical protein
VLGTFVDFKKFEPAQATSPANKSEVKKWSKP